MNYIGSKLSLMDFLTESIGQVCKTEGGVFADLFAGTGIVGATFRQKGYEVLSNDIQYYSYVLNKHYIENTETVDASLIDELNALNGIESFVYRNYCNGSGSQRNYFTDENGKKCDAIRTEIDTLYQNGKITENQRFSLLASLINSIDKYANTASVYGAFLKHIKKTAAKPFVLEALPVIDGKPGQVYNENINTLITKVKGDILYLDPPYNARQYCSNYHVLETIARYDHPTVYGKTGLRDTRSQRSQYCSAKSVGKAMDELLANADFKYIFISYNNEGLLSLDDMRELMQKYGTYQLFSTDYHRFKADKEEKRNHKAAATVEYLHCITK